VGYLGGLSVYKIKLDNGLEMKATVTNVARPIRSRIGVGDRVWFAFPPEAGLVLLQ
jgi:putrescine transport system ATP-binding protein